jgi:hypothetical protein
MTEPANDIRYLTRKEIDINKWDQCIGRAANGLIYARPFYLDAMVGHWSALVEGDYDRVMPLTWNKKFGFPYLYQPYFVKTLGVFGSGPMPIEISRFLQAIPGKYKFWDIDLNENNFVSGNAGLPLKQYGRTNQLIPLNREYSQISNGFSRLARRMKKRAAGNGLNIIRGREPDTIIRLCRQDDRYKSIGIRLSVWEKLIHCIRPMFENKQAQTYLALSPGGKVLAYYLVLSDERYIYSLLGGSTAAGKQTGAFYLLTDAAIQDHAGTERTFRFEGSDIPGVAFFNRLFGPVRASYPHLIMNNLPFPFRLFK